MGRQGLAPIPMTLGEVAFMVDTLRTHQDFMTRTILSEARWATWDGDTMPGESTLTWATAGDTIPTATDMEVTTPTPMRAPDSEVTGATTGA